MALFVAGGLSYQRELGYVDPGFTFDELLSINIQNTRLGGWGNPDFLGFSSYGPPFDLFISGSLPTHTTFTSVELVNLVVTAEGRLLLSVPRAVLQLEDQRVIRGGVESQAKGFGYSSHSFASLTPPSITVSGTMVFTPSAGSQPFAFKKVFIFNLVRRVSLGSRTWRL